MSQTDVGLIILAVAGLLWAVVLYLEGKRML
jgi:hypothetical protein